MRKTIRNIVILVLIGVGFILYNNLFVEPKLEKARTELKKSTIKNDSLVKIKEGLYKKLVADTLTKKQLKKKADSLELELKNPQIVEVIKIVPKEIEKDIDSISILNSILTVKDYYPNKDNPFIEYTSNINLIAQEGKGKFSFPNTIDISLGIEQQKDGTYKVKSKVPEFLQINQIDVQSLPMETKRQKDFGFIVGGGYGKDENSGFLNANAGIRVKKTYLMLSAGTNKSLSLNLNFEL